MAVALKDVNSVASAIFESSTTPGLILRGKIDEITGRVLVDNSGSGGSALAQETATGTVDGSNVTFGLVNQPVNVFADGILHPVSASVNDFGGNAVTWVAGVLTFNALTPPTQYVVGYYNS